MQQEGARIEGKPANLQSATSPERLFGTSCLSSLVYLTRYEYRKYCNCRCLGMGRCRLAQTDELKKEEGNIGTIHKAHVRDAM